MVCEFMVWFAVLFEGLRCDCLRVLLKLCLAGQERISFFSRD
jgi:hypothetical protein